jgi:hypothetical protein
MNEINAKVFTNLDPKYPATPKEFRVKFPCMPQIGNTFMWDDRRLKIIDISWTINGMGYAELTIEINK